MGRWNSYIFGWNAAYGLDDEIDTYIFGWNAAYGLDDEIIAVLVQMLYSSMIKLACFFLEIYMVGRRTPHTSF
jgi:hypothetical protein